MKILSKIWMIASLIVITILSVITNSSIIQIIAAICGVVYVFNTVLENKYGQLFGVINSLLYGYIMFNNGVYGTCIYNIVYCIPIQIYTFFTWGKDKTGKNKIEISRFNNVQRLGITIITGIVIAIYCIVASKLNVQFALVDGISIILGIIGLYMTSKKKLEQWYCFIISNVAMIALWAIKCTENISNMPMLLMWIIYIINNTYGLYTWSRKIKVKSKQKTKENTTA